MEGARTTTSVSRTNPTPNLSQLPAQLPQGKVNSVQGLRAVAVLLVVYTHSIVAAGYHSRPRQAGFFHLQSFGACGLDIFFVISGFIVSLVATRAAKADRNSARRFLSRRITRIFPLYWILTLVVIAEAELGAHHILWHRVPWFPSVCLLPGWHYPVPPLILSLGWSLLFEIYFYLVLAAWMRLTPSHLVRNTIIFLAAMVAVGEVVGLHRPLLVIWSNPVALEFVFGSIIGQMYVRLAARTTVASSGNHAAQLTLLPGAPWLAAIGAIALAATLFTGCGPASQASAVMAGIGGWQRLGVWGVPAAVLVLGGVLWNPAMQSFPARLLIFLGDASYSIYLCTNPARSLVEHFWRYFGLWGGDIGVLLCLLVVTAIGTLCYLIIERPMMRLFRNWYKQLPVF